MRARRESRRKLELTAFKIHDGHSMPIVPASSSRAWMEGTHSQFAKRCLPLLIANQCGWFILNTHKIMVTWNGLAGINDLSVVHSEHPQGLGCPASSHFGYGILTFSFNYLFRTARGYSLWVRGPSNWPKDGIAPLEGIVESDWSVSSFTMNWKCTRPGSVEFLPGDPVCMIVPIRRGEIEAFHPGVRLLSDEEDLYNNHISWAQSRSRFLGELRDSYGPAVERGWQKSYMLGQEPGASAIDHQVKLSVKPFVYKRAEGDA